MNVQHHKAAMLIGCALCWTFIGSMVLCYAYAAYIILCGYTFTLSVKCTKCNKENKPNVQQIEIEYSSRSKNIAIGCVQQRKQLSKRFALIGLYF